MSAPIHWPSTIAYTVDASLAFPDAAIERAFASWQSVLPYSFHRVALDGRFAVAPLTDVLDAFHLDWSPIAVNVTVIDSASRAGMASYVGLDLERAVAAGWEPWVVVLHEIGHAFGLVDRPWSTGSESLYGYAAPHATGLTADAIDFVQSGLGVSDRDDRIVVTGTAGGIIETNLAVSAGGNIALTDTSTDLDNFAASAPSFSITVKDSDAMTCGCERSHG